MRYLVPFLKPLVWRDLGLNPGLPGHWWTLYPLIQWAGTNCLIIITINGYLFSSLYAFPHIKVECFFYINPRIPISTDTLIVNDWEVKIIQKYWWRILRNKVISVVWDDRGYLTVMEIRQLRIVYIWTKKWIRPSTRTLRKLWSPK